jgi:hypothetical protein
MDGVRPLIAAFWVLILTLAAPARARGQEPGTQVVLLLAEAPRGGLVDALRIHLPPGTRVIVGPPPRAPSVADRIREAQEGLSDHRGGALAMWLDEDRLDGAERQVVVYLVARRKGSALVEIVSVRAGAIEELDRAIAVKVREVLDALREAERGLPAALARPEPEAAAPARGASPSSIEPAMTLELDLLGATSTATADPQLGGQVAAGLALQGTGWLADLVATARIATPLSYETGAGSVEVNEVAFGGAARALWVFGAFSVGGFAHAGARVLDGKGTTPLGAVGSADRLVPFLSTGPEMRVMLVRRLSVRAAVGVDFSLVRQRFSVNGQPVLDVGPARGAAEVGLVATLF